MTDDIVGRLRQKYAGQLPICAEAADEIERLREQVEDCENDFEILSQIFDKVRAERDRMRADND